MPTEVVVWVFPGVLFIVTVLVGVVFKFTREEVKELKDTNEEMNKRFLDLDSRILKSHNDVREEARQMVREAKEQTNKDVELLRSDMREQNAQMRELLNRMEQNLISQMKFFGTHKE